MMPGDAPVPTGPIAGAVPPSPQRRLAQIHGLVAAGGPPVTLLPIVDLGDRRTVAVEALPLFPDGDDADDWFADARGLGVALELELAIVAAALSGIEQVTQELPAGCGLWVAASPATVCTSQLLEILEPSPVPVTISVPATTTDHPGLLTAASRLRRSGARLAMDDVSADHADLRRLLQLHPDAVRVSQRLTRDIHRDLARVELTRAVVRVSQYVGAPVMAGAIQGWAEAETMLTLGIAFGQGSDLAAVPAPASPPAPSAPPAPGTTAADTNGPDGQAALVRPILDLIIGLTGLETAYLTVLDADHAWLEHRFVCNTGVLEVPEGLTIPWIDSLCKRCRDAGLMWTADVPGDLPPIPLGRDAPIRTFVSVPVVLADGRTAGTLCAMGSGPRELDGDMLAELAFFARLLAERYPRGLTSGPFADSTPRTHGHQLAAGDTRTPSPDTPGQRTSA
jgi:EAL domain-containing protein (putative c-di-GMP-specific phosphodiesterase class I)